MAQGRDAVASDTCWTRLQWRSHGPLPRLPQCQSLEHRGNHIACCDVYGEDADDVERITDLEHKLRKFHAYVTSFRVAMQTVLLETVVPARDSKHGADFTLSTIHFQEWEELETLGTCRIPPIATEFEDLGFALEDWLAKKRQYSEFSNRD